MAAALIGFLHDVVRRYETINGGQEMIRRTTVLVSLIACGLYMGSFDAGFLVDAEDHPWAFGRPAGIAVGKDGSLLVGCDKTGMIYRVSYEAR